MTRKKTPKVRAFLAAIARLPNVSWAAKAAGIRREQHYKRLKIDPAYKAAFEFAWAMGCGYLEDLTIAQSTDGIREPVFWQGEQVGEIVRYPWREFLLRGAMPEKYRDRHEHSGPNGGPIEAKLEVVFVTPDKHGDRVSGEAPVSV
jgi:hypothetical protein